MDLCVNDRYLKVKIGIACTHYFELCPIQTLGYFLLFNIKGVKIL